jgi:hypothetical protein
VRLSILHRPGRRDLFLRRCEVHARGDGWDGSAYPPVAEGTGRGAGRGGVLAGAPRVHGGGEADCVSGARGGWGLVGASAGTFGQAAGEPAVSVSVQGDVVEPGAPPLNQDIRPALPSPPLPATSHRKTGR